ncbi:hypothetical protein Rhopal_000091-T1 [Rhodotorula paludigena]|uniref:EF-hand domain-containing protein n=1 Tax=Rhodotorula paludigena TaxID=86838 RepID=A0AAV5GBW8_9BASI|nr:hypothetical protein Rhopal_000091-T1 [Rhodotorula paludigena]
MPYSSRYSSYDAGADAYDSADEGYTGGVGRRSGAGRGGAAASAANSATAATAAARDAASEHAADMHSLSKGMGDVHARLQQVVSSLRGRLSPQHEEAMHEALAKLRRHHQKTSKAADDASEVADHANQAHNATKNATQNPEPEVTGTSNAPMRSLAHSSARSTYGRSRAAYGAYASRYVASDSDAEDDYNRRENRPSTSREVHSARHLTDAVKASEGLANETSARLSSILHNLESTLAHYDRTGRIDRDKFLALIEHVRQSLAHAPVARCVWRGY